MASQNYGKTEQQLARILDRDPYLKQQAKKSYQTINFLLHKKDYTFQCDLTLERVGRHSNGEFFGYFQNSPERNGHIAYLAPSTGSLKYKRCFPIDIFVDGEKISETTAWNWQQGSMLWWINDNEICHNVFENGAYRARIVDRQSQKHRTLDMPLCAVSPDGTQGYSIDFEKLAALNPDYGYFCKNHDATPAFPKAIHAINLQDNRVTASLDMPSILGLTPRPNFKSAKHEINHISVSPDSQRIMFIHRWHQNGKNRQSRLVTANHDLTDLYCLTNDEMVSHCTWKNSSQIIGWMQFNGIAGYYLLNDNEDKHEIIEPELLCSDGHPTVIQDEWLLTDTYPDRARMSHLLLYHLQDRKLIRLGEFFNPLKFWGATRCDLHPKYSSDSNSVFFESVHTGQRCLYQLKLENLIGNHRPGKII